MNDRRAPGGTPPFFHPDEKAGDPFEGTPVGERRQGERRVRVWQSDQKKIAGDDLRRSDRRARSAMSPAEARHPEAALVAVGEREGGTEAGREDEIRPGLVLGVGTGAAVNFVQSVCAACRGPLDLGSHGWRDRPGELRIAICRTCHENGTPLAPPLEQQNEPAAPTPPREPAPAAGTLGSPYKRGFMDGVRAYAHWREGRQEVGTTGTLLSHALRNVEDTWNYAHEEDQ